MWYRKRKAGSILVTNLFAIGICTSLANTYLFHRDFSQEIKIAGVITLSVITSWLIWVTYKRIRRTKRAKALELAQIDTLSGTQFEEYIECLFNSRGYNTKRTGGSGDLGVDLIAKKGNQRLAIQAKRYRNGVSRRAVSDAVAGMQFYKCNQAMVITNSFFTKGAKELAGATQCQLVDRTALAELIINFQK